VEHNAVLTSDEEQVLELIPSSLTKAHADILESCMDMTLGEEVCDQNAYLFSLIISNYTYRYELLFISIG